MTEWIRVVAAVRRRTCGREGCGGRMYQINEDGATFCGECGRVERVDGRVMAGHFYPARKPEARKR